MQKIPVKRILSIIGCLLALALVNDFASIEMNWSFADYVIAAILLGAVALAMVIMNRKLKSKRARLVAYTIIAVLFVLVWGELAVGLFGTPWAGN